VFEFCIGDPDAGSWLQYVVIFFAFFVSAIAAGEATQEQKGGRLARLAAGPAVRIGAWFIVAVAIYALVLGTTGAYRLVLMAEAWASVNFFGCRAEDFMPRGDLNWGAECDAMQTMHSWTWLIFVPALLLLAGASSLFGAFVLAPVLLAPIGLFVALFHALAKIAQGDWHLLSNIRAALSVWDINRHIAIGGHVWANMLAAVIAYGQSIPAN
jgi:hypothetical protein